MPRMHESIVVGRCCKQEVDEADMSVMGVEEDYEGVDRVTPEELRTWILGPR